MTSRDFVLIARVIRNLSEAPEVRARVAAEFAAELRFTNVRFDRDRFLAACQASTETAR
jgi:hypothetical protein